MLRTGNLGLDLSQKTKLNKKQNKKTKTKQNKTKRNKNKQTIKNWGPT